MNNPRVNNVVTYDFSGNRVLVTGGSNGLGLAIARSFSVAGAKVTITGTRADAAAYDHDLSEFDYLQCSMTDRDRIAEIAAGLDGLDVLVNNAGQSLTQKGEWNPEVFEESLRVNLVSGFRMATACLPLLRASGLDGGAAVVNVASMASFFAVGMVPGYGAAKAGIVQMTKTMGAEWASKNVRVNAIAPGLTATNMTAALQKYPEYSKPTLDRTPARRWADPMVDVAPVALFLASPAARFVIGQTLAVDGGFSIQG
ncbi:SDR family NAD(P)-dependent oxidoreductase [Nocardia sp. CA-136227]|uniref:SDR family NAD(P)-dependent oxidoreductase n=1 Tax=Nocardia sp. CA-136227 TaxID=3239979 RepID=UPI003D97A827